MKKVVIWVLVGVLLVAAAVYYNNRLQDEEFMEEGQKEEEEQQEENQQGQQGTAMNEVRVNVAENDFSFQTLDGNVVKLNDYQGKVVIINFWASWCYWCNYEMPEFEELWKDLKEDENIVLLMVNLGETKEVAEQFIKDGNYTFDVYLDPQEEVASKLGVRYFPTTIILDQEGGIAKTMEGATTKKKIEQVLEKL